MNVAHCIHGLGLGGAQEIIRQIVGGRQAQGRDGGKIRYFVYSCEDGVLRKRVDEAGATVRIVPRRLPKLDPSWVAGLWRAMRRDCIDVVHTHLFGDSLHGYLAARVAGKLPVVMTLHIGPEGLSGVQRAGYRWLLARATQAVACSNVIQRSYEAEGWPVRRPLLTVRNGIEPPALRFPPANGAAGSSGRPAGATAGGPPPGGTPEGAMAVLRGELGIDPALAARPDLRLVAAVGRLTAQKGYRYLIGALPGLRQAVGGAWRLVFVGDGELREELARQAEASGVGDMVVFAGFRDDVARLLPAIDVVVFSSLFEGLPVALLEAMAAARCVVATDVDGIGEAVRDGHEALLVPPADATLLGCALSQALADGELRRRLGAAAERRFRESFTADRMVALYESLYRQAGGLESAHRHGGAPVAPRPGRA